MYRRKKGSGRVLSTCYNHGFIRIQTPQSYSSPAKKKRKMGEPELEISLADLFRAHVKMAEGAAVVELPENREGERKCRSCLGS